MRTGPIPLDLPDVPLPIGLLICFGPPLGFFLVLLVTHKLRQWRG